MIKLIHTADLHLGARMDTVYPAEIAKERRREQKAYFEALFSFADREGVSGILVAGDLFDSARPREEVKNHVLQLLVRYPHIGVYYLRGNHDAFSFPNPPENLHTFSDEVTGYDLGDGILLYGCEHLTEERYARLLFDKDKVNLLLLHGAVTESGSGADIVNLRLLRRRYIDYLALGHYHTASIAELDARGAYAYAGTPFGRGFDECGQKGFYLLEIEGGRVTPRFTALPSRTLHEVTPVLTGEESASDCFLCMEDAVRGIPETDIVRLRLPQSAAVTPAMAAAYLAPRFFYSEVKSVSPAVFETAERYLDEISLRGEFVRAVYATTLSEEEKSDILTYGLAALRGEEVDDV